MKLAKAYLILHLTGRRIIYDLGKNDIEIDTDYSSIVPVGTMVFESKKSKFECNGTVEKTIFYPIRSSKGKKAWNKFLKGLKI